MSRNAKLRLVQSTSPTEEIEAPNGGQIEPDGNEEPASSRQLASRAALDSLADDSLVALAIEGDMGAAETLYRRYASFAFNLAARIAGTTTDVEDVVHDAFLRAFDSLETLRNAKAFRSWLGSIVVHAMRSRLRRGRLVRLFGLGRGGDPIDIDCIASDHASPRVRAELAQVYALLRTLPADVRIAWTLRFVEGHDLRTAAELSGCSLATVKRRIRRAQDFMKEHFVGAEPASLAEPTDDSSESDHPTPHARNKSGPSKRRSKKERAS